MPTVVCGNLVYIFDLIFPGWHRSEDVEQFCYSGRPFLYRIFDLGRIVRHIEDDRYSSMLHYNKRYIVVVLEIYYDGFVPSIHHIVVVLNL